MKFPYLIVLGFVALMSACENQSVPFHTSKKIKITSTKTIKVKTKTDPDSVCIAAVGDIMLGSSYPDSSKLPPDNALNSFKQMMADVADADLTFGNLEGTLLDTGAPDKHKKKIETGYLFRMPTSYAGVLKNAGFNVLSIANNHITDFGVPGCTSTTKVLDSVGIHYAGLQSHPSTIFLIKGIKYGFCAFAPNSNTASINDLKSAAHIIKRLKGQCDIVIVSFHGGSEGAAYEHVPFKNEFFYNENRGNVYAFAHNAVDAGADIILGNGPHVSRAMEMYRGRIIAYSLGNFCTYKNISVNGLGGMAPLLKVYLDKKGRFLSGRIIAFTQSHDKGLQHDDSKGAIGRIRALTEADFPQSGLIISDNGKIGRQNS